MKRISLVLALAVLLTLAVGAPAFAWSVEPQDGAYLTVWDDSWTLVSGGDVVATYDATATPIPTGTPVWVSSGWYGGTYGLIKTIPLTFREKFTLDDVPVVPSFAAGKAYWSAVYLVTDSQYPTFNPKMGVKIYARDWWVSVGVLDSGPHDLVFTEKITHPVTDLLGGYYDGQHKPAFYPAGTTVFEMPFTVQ